MIALIPLVAMASVWLSPQAKPKGDFVKLNVEAQDLQTWGDEAKKLMIEWYPKIEKLLGAKKIRPIREVELYVKDHGDGVAGTSNRRIEVNGDYVRKRPKDIGLVVHELAHVVQDYPEQKDRNVDDGWLVEGIADYVRWFNYEPASARRKVNPDKADYHHGYQEAAAFITWAQLKHDKNLVKQLDKTLKQGDYEPGIWVKLTKKSLDDLWAEYIASLR